MVLIFSIIILIKRVYIEKSTKMPLTIYADLECLFEKISTCQNNPNK